MKILHLARRYRPLLGGVETHVAEVSAHHLAAGHQVTVITMQDEPTLGLESQEAGVQVLRVSRLPRQEKRERSLGFKLHLWRWIWRHRHEFVTADVVQVHDVFWWVWPVYWLVAPKLSITFHGWEGQYPVRWQARVQRWLANHLSQGVIHVGAWIQELYGDQPDYVVYGGSNPHAIPSETNSSSANSDISPDSVQLRLVFIGRLEKTNEVETYLHLLQLLKDRQIKVAMTWVGDGSYREACQQVGQVTGMVTDSASYLRTADIVLANSYLSMLEAQATGAIVVAAYTNYLKQRYVESYPIQAGLVTGQTAAELLEKLEVVSLDPASWATQTQAAALEAQQYTWEKIAQTYLNLWRIKPASMSPRAKRIIMVKNSEGVDRGCQLTLA